MTPDGPSAAIARMPYDPASLRAVGGVADNFAYMVGHSAYIADKDVGDNRIQAYALKSLLLAYLLKAPSVGNSRFGWPGGNDWAAKLREGLTKILATRDADGQWRMARCGNDATGQPIRSTHPFMPGLLYDVLIRYY